MFFGTFHHSIDPKGRTSLPVKFRDALAAAGEGRFVLMQYPHWRSLLALPQSRWAEMVKRVTAASPLDAKFQMNALRFFSTAHEVDLDPHGRVLVPPALRAYAGFEKEVVWVGLAGTFQLFSKAEYEKQMTKAMDPADILDLFGKA